MSISRVAVAAALAMLAGCQTAGQPQANGSCRPEFSSFQLGTTSNWLMIVGPMGCNDQMEMRGSDITASSIVQQPANGTAYVNSTFYGYSPNVGFTGADKFVMQLTGSSNGREGTSTVIVNVQVRPGY